TGDAADRAAHIAQSELVGDDRAPSRSAELDLSRHDFYSSTFDSNRDRLARSWRRGGLTKEAADRSACRAEGVPIARGFHDVSCPPPPPGDLESKDFGA